MHADPPPVSTHSTGDCDVFMKISHTHYFRYSLREVAVDALHSGQGACKMMLLHFLY